MKSQVWEQGSELGIGHGHADLGTQEKKRNKTDYTGAFLAQFMQLHSFLSCVHSEVTDPADF